MQWGCCPRNSRGRQAKSGGRVQRRVASGLPRSTFHVRLPTADRSPPTGLPPCPHLPAPRAGLDWRVLHRFRDAARGAEFYFACLEYGHALWSRGQAARALLCLDRALGADLRGDEPVLRDWPLPYAAMAWILAQTPPAVFLGNPRVHFQHYAVRMSGPRSEPRRWRAWGCWALARAVRPELPGDPRHRVEEPAAAVIEAQLRVHGLPGEADLWRAELKKITPRPGGA